MEDGSFGASGVGVCKLVFLSFLFQLAMEEFALSIHSFRFA